jgi:hypothetical protein
LRVFLCHSSGDKPAVRNLYQQLQREGIDPWIDEEALLGGQDWDREIRKAVRAVDVVIVCLSHSSVTKAGYLQKEIKFVLDVADEQPEGTIFVVPLRLEECEVPERLARWHWVNLYEERGFERLVLALQARAKELRLSLTTNHGRESREALPVLLNPIPLSILAGSLAILLLLIFRNVVLPASPTPSASTVIAEISPTSLADTPAPVTTPSAEASTWSGETAEAAMLIQTVRSLAAPGQQAQGITWDGKYLWLSDTSGTIFQLDSTGKTLGAFDSPDVTPQGLAWDGSNFWVFVTNQSFIYRFQISEKKTRIISSFRAPAHVVGGGISQDMAWDGQALWYANNYNVYRLVVHHTGFDE